MITITNSRGVTVAFINKQNRHSDGYQAHAPWRLLYLLGRVERFAKLDEAKAEAKKSWPGCTFQRT